jgi:1-phosphofructokinase
VTRLPTPSVITVCLNPAVDRVLEVDRLVVGAHQVGREVRRFAGGKAINVSRVLAALGVRSVATGFLGDQNRDSFDALLKEARVGDELFALPGRTRENVTIAETATGAETHIRDAGLEVPARALDRLRRKLALLAGERDVVIFSGSLPPGVSPEAFAALVGACAEAGARVAVDTSGPALSAVAGRPLWLVKPNAAELPALIGRDLPNLGQQRDAARELTRRVENVILTRGEQGADLFRRDLAVHARLAIEPGRVRSTVGCGDALLAAYVAGVLTGLGPRRAFAEAVACAAASAMTLGPGQFDPQVLQRLKPDVHLAAP